jgi:hypothetical protein
VKVRRNPSPAHCPGDDATARWRLHDQINHEYVLSIEKYPMTVSIQVRLEQTQRHVLRPHGVCIVQDDEK